MMLLTSLTYGGKFYGYLSTNTYTFSRQNQDDSTLVHTRLYQSVWLQGRDVLLKNSRLNVSGVFYMDPVNPFHYGDEENSTDADYVFQIYNFNYSTSWFSKKLIIVLGRQFQYSVSDAGRLDGISTDYSYRKIKMKGFAGLYVPASGMTENPSDDYFYGGEISWKKSKAFDLKIGYSDKSHSRADYHSNLVFKDVKVPPSIRQRVGIQSRLTRGQVTFYARTRHQLRPFDLDDATIQTTYHGRDGQKIQNVVLEYDLRKPRIPDNSIFSVFDTYSSQEISFRGRLSLVKQFSGWFNVRKVLFNNDQSSIILFGTGTPLYQLEVIFQGGYGGSSNRVVAGIRKSIKKLNIAGRVSLGNYRLIEGQWNDLSTVTLSGSYPVWNKLEINSELHVLKNKYYTNDTRLQLGIRYRL